jgi:hypothetical protein
LRDDIRMERVATGQAVASELPDIAGPDPPRAFGGKDVVLRIAGLFRGYSIEQTVDLWELCGILGDAA